MLVVADIGPVRSSDELETAIITCKHCGVDWVKVQAYERDSLCHPTNPGYEDLFDVPRGIMSWGKKLANKRGMKFGASVFDAGYLEDVIDDLDFVKIAVGSNNDKGILDLAGELDKPVVISLLPGEDLSPRFVPCDKVYVLLARYDRPARARDYIEAYFASGFCYDGFSDHTADYVLPVWAAAHDCGMIERHLAWGMNGEGEPSYGFKVMVDWIREVGLAGQLELTPKEREEVIGCRRGWWQTEEGPKLLRPALGAPASVDCPHLGEIGQPIGQHLDSGHAAADNNQGKRT